MPNAFNARARQNIQERQSVILTPKEIQVLACLIDGDTDKTVALKTGISVHTIKAHLLKSIFRKLGIENRTQAAVWAWRHGLDIRGDGARVLAINHFAVDRDGDLDIPGGL